MTTTMTMNTRQSNSVVLRDYPTYEMAQRTVDGMSDAGFPVEHLRIVGHGVDTVEQVTGRTTKGKAALMGAGSGAMFGLLIGLLFSIFAITAAGVLASLTFGLVTGALVGAVFGFVAHWSTGGRRDFSSISSLVAKRYTVQVDADYLDEATRIADRL